jgi:NADH dehydrogenase
MQRTSDGATAGVLPTSDEPAAAPGAAPPDPAPAAAAEKPARPRVVIVGGGFGGIEVAKGLRRAPVDVTLVDRQNHHCFQPLLYQVATAALTSSDVAWPIRGIVGSQRNTTVQMAEVTSIDRQARVVHAGPASWPYDYLVVATGSTHSYFGHGEWSRDAPGLKTIEDAVHIRRRLLLAFERAEVATDPEEQRRLTTFVIVGGGPTGVELAGAVSELARHTLPLDFRRIDPQRTRVLLLEAGPRLLPTFPQHLSDHAARALARKGVEVRVDEKVEDLDTDGVRTSRDTIGTDTVIWAAGVKASPAGDWLGVAHDKSGRVPVRPDLTLADDPCVFVIGDTAAVVDESGKPVPGIAPAAKQMGQYVADVIRAGVEGRAAPAAFRYRHQGDLATIGRRSAVVKLGRLELTGTLGWLFWSLVHVYFLIGTRNRLGVAFDWIWNYLTYQRRSRLITLDRVEAPSGVVEVAAAPVPPND